MKRVLLIILQILILNCAFAQNINTQLIRGKILDKDTRTPLIGVSVSVLNSNPIISSASDIDGNFRLEKVPVGRQNIKFSYLGYEDFILNEVYINSAKEMVVSVELLQAVVQKNEVIIVAKRAKDKPLNEMSTVSARTFNVEETQRYASSVNDVGRMAAGFAGVAPAKDNNNDIVVRGNSPVGVLWRLEGIDIPNPNHFARRGSSGGGISIINASLLDNSDFSTGAFAAEYGNALSAVFDLKFRKGNNEKKEFTAKAGMLGLEFATEGPFSKKQNSSYLVNYRYSTLGILNKMGVYLVGKNVSNTYQDINFNISLPTEKAGIFTVFGLGGISKEERVIEKDTSLWKFRNDFLHYRFNTNMGATGVTWLYNLGPKTYIKSIAMAGASQVEYNEDTAQKNLQESVYSREKYLSGRYSLHTYINHKFNAKNTLKTGVLISNLFYNMKLDLFNRTTRIVETRINGKGNANLIQPYAQLKTRIGSSLTANIGIHAMYLTLNNTYSIEPRVGIKWDFWDNQSISFAYGLHSQVQPLGNYFTEIPQANGTSYFPNKKLDLTKAHHYILSYDLRLTENFRIKVEPYYQQLFNLPIGYDKNSTYMLLNERDGYARDTLVSEGKGTNKGIDLTVEKFFNKGVFFLLSCSWFDSKYQTHSTTKYNTKFNMKQTYSLLAGKEFNLKKGILELGTRLVYMGGYWYSQIDAAKSSQMGETIYLQVNPYSLQMPDYWRVDLRFAYKINRAKFASIIALDIQNATAHKNVWKQDYDVDKQQITYIYQSSIVPVISYRIDF